jgi:hypothetical protein
MMKMWWTYIVVVPLFALGIYGFILLARTETGWLSRRTTRTVDSTYDSYADSLRKQRRYANKHGGTWRDGGTTSPSGGPGTTDR